MCSFNILWYSLLVIIHVLHDTEEGRSVSTPHFYLCLVLLHYPNRKLKPTSFPESTQIKNLGFLAEIYGFVYAETAYN